jgi:hypothetical protein
MIINWAKRHQDILSNYKKHHTAIVFIGNSITPVCIGDPWLSITPATE